MKTNKVRSSYNLNFITDNYNLPLLKDNTSDVIEFSDEVEVFKKKKKKYKFWDLINK